MSFCRKCGAELKEGAKFCQSCGAEQNSKDETQIENISTNVNNEPGETADVKKSSGKLGKTTKIIIVTVIAVIAVIFGGYLTTKFVSAQKANSNIKLANKYLDEGKYDEAILEFNKAIQVDKKNIDARLGLGKAYVQAKKYDKAESVLQEASSIAPKNKTVKTQLSSAYITDGKDSLTTGNKTQASKKFEKAVAVDSSNIQPYLDAADAYAEAGYVSDGIDILKKGYESTKDVTLNKKIEEFNKKFAGNSINNILVGGYIAKEGDWIYYSNPSDKFSMYKMKEDGSSKTKLNSGRCSCINVIGDWIYYIDCIDYIEDSDSSVNMIKKMKTDGTGVVKLGYDTDDNKFTSGNLSNLYVTGGRIYYSYFNDNIISAIVSTNLDGRDEKVFSLQKYETTAPLISLKLNPHSFIVDGDWIYYVGCLNDGRNFKIHKIKVNGTGETELNTTGIDIWGNIWLSNKKLYYISQNYNDTNLYLYMTDSNFTKNESILTFEYNGIENLANDIVYYSIGNQLYRYSAGITKKICDTNEYVDNIEIAGDWLYLLTWGKSNNGVLYRVKIDGTQLQAVN